jgi:hypothetical protein
MANCGCYFTIILCRLVNWITSPMELVWVTGSIGHTRVEISESKKVVLNGVSVSLLRYERYKSFICVQSRLKNVC